MGRAFLRFEKESKIVLIQLFQSHQRLSSFSLKKILKTKSMLLSRDYQRVKELEL